MHRVSGEASGTKCRVMLERRQGVRVLISGPEWKTDRSVKCKGWEAGPGLKGQGTSIIGTE